ncbi:MAG: hypothetical protein A2664_04270 [Candidatus Taylorbacteria bacterium RIFCSPHIGHO2_01_FULL_46_22b]|uniref:30S ribosomal protein S21 n=1 Tax=Candidatus Taylorbacteria bacterium RIFCSPHIGHO2_01_FULL_46_22b TaxID=1802301 RepID=A0A1G2M422_9BACT|nr:MAG: hypothetical protein A2664_04270 [Candidatus Taylorbacteria bacterium RIFCSPHIGHO2_01_FULL_46_22b]
MASIQIERTNNENGLSLLRRFNKRIQGAGIVKAVRGNRYKERNKSPLTRKKRALNQLRRRTEIIALVKLGKLPDKMSKPNS